MNFNDYEKTHFLTYEAFAKTVSLILKALLTASNLPRPQSVQYRAKSIERLKRRLAEADKINTQTLESDRRDLAGVRLIFYTNNDVDRFVASPLIHENFEIEEHSTRIHRPTVENQGAQYRGIHYTAKLREDRLRLPEYAKFADLRCEIQVQTILEHAWSETSHDILYKNDIGKGYGEKTMKGIDDRFRRIMDKYLLPAGYEFQKVQQDYERLLQGKELFDKDIANLLEKAQNNNERHDILMGLKDYAIPHYDDRSAAFEGLKGPLLRTVQAARTTLPIPIETPIGNLDGFKADSVIRLVIEVIETLCYAAPVGSLQLLIDIYREETNENIRGQILNTVKKLSEYNIEIYNKVGPMLQMALVDRLAGMSDVELDKIRPIALVVWRELVQSDITGAKWTADSVIWTTAAAPVSDPLREVRDKAITALFAAFDRSANDDEKREVLLSLDAAANTPHNVQYSNQLLATTLKDATRIVDFVTQRVKTMSYELMQHSEHRFFYDYMRAKELTVDPERKFDCQAEASALLTAIIKFRDTINADDRFVRYKVLVGFESIFPDHWIDEEFDHKEDEYRTQEADCYIDEINAANEDDWFDLIERCAKTKSNDLATFPVFGHFISNIAERKPELADRLLAKASDDLRQFLPGILNGLARSGREDIYERILESELNSARTLTAVAWHIRKSNFKKPHFPVRLLKRAIENRNQRAVTDCLLFALEYYGTEKVPDADHFMGDALNFLNEQEDSTWISQAWFLDKATKFYEELTPERTALVLRNLGYLRKVDFQAERILVRLAERQPDMVWDYFDDRLAKKGAGAEHDGMEERFEAVPFQFHGLEKELSKNPQLAISKGFAWFAKNSELFEFRGGSMLSRVFPNCTPEFATALAELVKAGGHTEADFALEILQNYHGESSTHVVLKEVVSRFKDASRMAKVQACIDSTGVVSGEFGFAQALRTKKETLADWLSDSRQAVRAFAEGHIAELDLMIAYEARRAETRREMRIRSYVEDDETSGDEGG